LVKVHAITGGNKPQQPLQYDQPCRSGTSQEPKTNSIEK